jgi:hypothetical protein
LYTFKAVHELLAFANHLVTKASKFKFITGTKVITAPTAIAVDGADDATNCVELVILDTVIVAPKAPVPLVT